MLELLMMEVYSLLIGATIMAVIMKIIVAAFFIFAIIGFITTIRFFTRRKKKKAVDPHKVWLKTGKWPD